MSVDGTDDRPLPQLVWTGETLATPVAWTPRGIYYRVTEYRTDANPFDRTMVAEPFSSPSVELVEGARLQSVSRDGNLVLYSVTRANRMLGLRLLDRAHHTDRPVVNCVPALG